MANLFAGAAMRKITPPLEMLPKLATEREPYKGVHSDMFGRVIVVSDGTRKAALIGADTGIFPNAILTEKRLMEEFGFEPYSCLFSATHNHEAPKALFLEGSDPEPMMRNKSETSDAYARFVLEQFVDATREAIANLKPARMGVNLGQSYINCNRDLPTPIGGMQSNNFKGTSDHDLLVIKFEDMDGEPIGVYVNHATHSNYMCWNLYNGDYPMVNADLGGGISQFVEKALKNKCPVIWAKGCAGDQNPITRSSWRIVRVDDNGEYTFEQVYFKYEDNLLQLENLVGTQGLEIMELLDTMTEYTDEFTFKGAETFRSIPARQSYNQLKLQLKCHERPEPVPFDPPRTVDFRFRLANLCGVSFVNLNNESYSGLGLLIKRLLPTKYTAPQCVTFGHCGYIPDTSMEWVNGFGTMNSNAWSAEMTEEAYTDAITQLRKEVYGK